MVQFRLLKSFIGLRMRPLSCSRGGGTAEVWGPRERGCELKPYEGYATGYLRNTMIEADSSNPGWSQLATYSYLYIGYWENISVTLGVNVYVAN